MKKSASLALVVVILAVDADTLAVSAADRLGVTGQPLGCLIQPERVAEVGSPVVGVIESMMVERGDTVHKGQVIAVLRNAVDRASLNVAHSRAKAEAEVRAASANLSFARQSLSRARGLYEKKFISSQALDQAAAETEVAQQKLVQAQEQKRIWSGEVDVARARLEDRTIRSPFDGVIAERYLSAGERVEVQPLVRVAKVDPLRIEVIMPGTLYGTVVTGSMAQITPDLAGANPVSAQVTLVDRILDAASGTFRVRLNLPNPDARIPAGLRCKIAFAAEAAPDKPAPQKTSASMQLEPADPKIGSAAATVPATRTVQKTRAVANLKPVSLRIGYAAAALHGTRYTGHRTHDMPIRLKLDLTLSPTGETNTPARNEI